MWKKAAALAVYSTEKKNNKKKYFQNVKTVLLVLQTEGEITNWKAGKWMPCYSFVYKVHKSDAGVLLVMPHDWGTLAGFVKSQSAEKGIALRRYCPICVKRV